MRCTAASVVRAVGSRVDCGARAAIDGSPFFSILTNTDPISVFNRLLSLKCIQ